MKNVLYLLCITMLPLAGCKSNQYADLGDGLYAHMKTTKGDIVLRLEYEKTPVTVASFVTLAEGSSPYVSDEYKDKPYFNGVTFHRVMNDFMIQGGDPTATGRGGPGYQFKDEFNDSLRHNRKGLLSMANPGYPNTNGSQFFITHAETPWLDGKHTIFGEVVAGIEVVDSIAVVEVAEGSNKPITDVVMEEVNIIRQGKAARKFDALEVMQDYFAEIEAKQAAVKAFGESLVAQRMEADSMASGLKYIVLETGEGPKPEIGQMVLVNYAGYLENGTLFDTNIEAEALKSDQFEVINRNHRGIFQPSPMLFSPDSRLVAGFKEALLSMQVGDKWRVFIPPYLGYGPQGSGPIPPNANLIFDLELIGINE